MVIWSDKRRWALFGGVAVIMCFLAALIFTVSAPRHTPQSKVSTRVDPGDYDAFWLWAGIKPQPVLYKARTIYILDSEINDGPPVTLIEQRPAMPHVADKQVWMVVRVETIQWPAGLDDHIIERLSAWKAAGNNLVGLQIDFDAGTKGLENYADFLKTLRRKMPSDMKLSVTGLLDWSANGDPSGLNALKGAVNEVVLQTYQGRNTITGYEHYLASLNRLDMPFKIGLVQDGVWSEPLGLRNNPNFQGYVVFLVNPRPS